MRGKGHPVQASTTTPPSSAAKPVAAPMLKIKQSLFTRLDYCPAPRSHPRISKNSRDAGGKIRVPLSDWIPWRLVRASCPRGSNPLADDDHRCIAFYSLPFGPWWSGTSWNRDAALADPSTNHPDVAGFLRVPVRGFLPLIRR